MTSKQKSVVKISGWVLLISLIHLLFSIANITISFLATNGDLPITKQASFGISFGVGFLMLVLSIGFSAKLYSVFKKDSGQQLTALVVFSIFTLIIAFPIAALNARKKVKKYYLSAPVIEDIPSAKKKSTKVSTNEELEKLNKQFKAGKITKEQYKKLSDKVIEDAFK